MLGIIKRADMLLADNFMQHKVRGKMLKEILR